MRTFVEAGLQDLSISRTSFQWGIPVPGDPKHVMYVWFDALTNYLTALGFGSDDPESTRRIDRFWPGVTHLVGKEILRQHALYWPAFLMSAGVTPPRPHHRARLVADGRRQDVEVAGQRRALPGLRRTCSASTGCGISSCARCRSAQDANFSDEAILTRFNADLANDLGNLVSRTTTMIHRYSGGIVPALPNSRDDLDAQLEQTLRDTIGGVVGGFETFQISTAASGRRGTWSGR